MAGKSRKYGTMWSLAELRASVSSYQRMLRKQREGRSYNKAAENLALRQGALRGRTRAAVEYRMQNISYVLRHLGQLWLEGYRPARNVGAEVEAAIRVILAQRGLTSSNDTEPTTNPQLAEERASRLLASGRVPRPRGLAHPKKGSGTSVRFLRDPKVAAWVRRQAGGKCEICGRKAPFRDRYGQPFLEIHHVKPLKHGGSDRVTNAVGTCPNCHREAHHCSDVSLFTSALYRVIHRLRRE